MICITCNEILDTALRSLFVNTMGYIERFLVRGSRVALKHVFHDMEIRTLVMTMRRRAIKRWVPCGDMDRRLKIPASKRPSVYGLQYTAFSIRPSVYGLQYTAFSIRPHNTIQYNRIQYNTIINNAVTKQICATFIKEQYMALQFSISTIITLNALNVWVFVDDH